MSFAAGQFHGPLTGGRELQATVYGIYLTVELCLLQILFVLVRSFNSLMENVRVKRAGFVFRQEYDVALERYERFSFLFSQAGGLYWYTTLTVFGQIPDKPFGHLVEA